MCEIYDRFSQGLDKIDPNITDVEHGLAIAEAHSDMFYGHYCLGTLYSAVRGGCENHGFYPGDAEQHLFEMASSPNSNDPTISCWQGDNHCPVRVRTSEMVSPDGINITGCRFFTEK